MCITLPILLGIVAAPLIARAADPPAGGLSPSGGSTAWNGTAATFGSADESTCQEGINCDTYTLTVNGTPDDWRRAMKAVKVSIGWSLSANDYDLYVHKYSNAGPLITSSANGAPQNGEAVVLNPAATGTGTYTVHVVYFVGAPTSQYSGIAEVVPVPSAVYLKGGFTFSLPRTASAPASTTDGEPSSRCDRFGNYYVAGIRGVPAGVDLWYWDLNRNSPTYDPYLRNPIYRGQPDSFTGEPSLSVGADGGGDVDLAVGFPLTGTPILAFSSLVASNVSTSVSFDQGRTWQKNPLGNVTGGIPVDDRQWMEFYGDRVVYLLYRTFEPAVTQIQQSTDGGLTWGPARTAGQIGQVGSCDVDQHDGTVYVAGSDGKVAVGIPDPLTHEPTTYTVHQVISGGNANLFLVVKIADDGTAYLCYSDGHDIYLTYSKNKGNDWSIPVRVSDGPETRTSLLPWLETGPVPGSVGIVWYGSPAANDDDTADWTVYFAQSMNATSAIPTFSQQAVSPYVIHGSNISLGGTLGNANRNLLDYFQISFDPQGQAVIAYTDDHNDYDGCVFVTHQIGGRTVNGTKANGKPIEGSALPAEQKISATRQVVDPAMDVTNGALGVIPANDPLDILSIDYSASREGTGYSISATMTVSQLDTIPPASNWRMSFTANAPMVQSALLGRVPFSYLDSDRGDQFYLQATTDPTGAPTYSWGTAARNSDGSLTYTSRGTAKGAIDTANRTITVSISADQLSAFLRKPLKRGNVICGLRGQTFVTGPVNGRYDRTRGGTDYVLP